MIAQDSGRAEHYRVLFSELESALRQIAKLDDRATFFTVLDRVLDKIPSLRSRASALRDLANLRNVIAHGTERIGKAIPTEESVDELQGLLLRIRSKNRTVDVFFKTVREFHPADSLSEALTFMHANDYSQIAVRREPRLAILTAINVAEWLAGKIEDDLISLQEHTVDDVLASARGKQYALLNRNATVADVEAAFLRAAEQEYQNLFCVIVTHSGRDSEKPLGIVTPWDLMHLPPAL